MRRAKRFRVLYINGFLYFNIYTYTFCYAYFEAAKCFEYKNATFERCWKMGYEKTAFPNYAGSISEMEASSLVNLVTTMQDATQCYRHASLFACSAFVPKCSGIAIVGRHTIPPCRSLCEGI